MTNDTWITIQELFEQYKVKPSTQAHLRRKGQIPFSKVNKMIRYNVDKINQWLEDANVAEVKDEKLSH